MFVISDLGDRRSEGKEEHEKATQTIGEKEKGTDLGKLTRENGNARGRSSGIKAQQE